MAFREGGVVSLQAPDPHPRAPAPGRTHVDSWEHGPGML